MKSEIREKEERGFIESTWCTPAWNVTEQTDTRPATGINKTSIKDGLEAVDNTSLHL
jgi:hypothetical protein